MMDVSVLPLSAETSTGWTCPQQRLGVVGRTGREIIGNDLSPRKVLSGNQSQQEHFYLPAQLYSSLVGKKNLLFFWGVGWGEGVSLPPFLFGFQ